MKKSIDNFKSLLDNFESLLDCTDIVELAGVSVEAIRGYRRKREQAEAREGASEGGEPPVAVA